jgi:hypothetical protein
MALFTEWMNLFSELRHVVRCLLSEDDAHALACTCQREWRVRDQTLQIVPSTVMGVTSAKALAPMFHDAPACWVYMTTPPPARLWLLLPGANRRLFVVQNGLFDNELDMVVRKCVFTVGEEAIGLDDEYLYVPLVSAIFVREGSLRWRELVAHWRKHAGNALFDHFNL